MEYADILNDMDYIICNTKHIDLKIKTETLNPINSEL